MSETASPLRASSRPASIHIWWLGGLAFVLVVAGAWLRTTCSPTSPATEPGFTATPSPDTKAEPATFQAPSPLALQSSPSLSASWRSSTNAALISQLLDKALPLTTRRQAARELASIGSDDAFAALKVALQEGPPYLKAAIGEGLGTSPHPQAQLLLLELANGTDEIAARGALRGLALRNEPESTDVLAQFLGNADKPESIRTEAALALGEVEQPEALEVLTRAATDLTRADMVESDEAILESILQGLGKRPFAETEAFFRNYLGTPGLPTESKTAALEALGQAEGEVAPFLLQYATDPEADVRAAAAWALNSTDSDSELGPALADLLGKETEPEVRLRLYQALGAQSGYDAPTVLALAQKETDPAARLAALGVLARACREDAAPDLLDYFKQIAIPELKNTALSGQSSSDRLASVIALNLSNTAEARDILRQIASVSGDRRVIEAAQAALKIQPQLQ